MANPPKIYLAIDNCFASKRWTRPGEWLSLARDLGLQNVEASADTEADPLYAGQEYISDWKREVEAAVARTGVNVVNLYSGHSTYSTLGLGHPDQRIRNRIRDRWVKPMIETANDLGAGLGFYCHAFPYDVLQEQSAYEAAKEQLFGKLAEVAAFGAEQKVRAISIEQMYAPHQYPWTIRGARELLKEVYRRSGAPFYITIDTGHASGQRSFTMPTAAQLRLLIENRPEARALQNVWLGSEMTRRHFMSFLDEHEVSKKQRALPEALESMKAHSYLFSSLADQDPYAWLSDLGAYSPIVHLQQVTGGASAHEPFTPELNRKGLISPLKVLDAIAKSYAVPEDPEMPPRCNSIFLTFEIFAPPDILPMKLLGQLEDSVDYWRQFVPVDGQKLNVIMRALSGGVEN